MGLLDDIIASDAQLVFGDTDGFAEAMSYEDPVDGSLHPFNGVASRAAPTGVSQSGGAGAAGRGGPLFALRTTIWIPFDPAGVRGIPTAPVKNARINFPTNVGDAPTPHVITSVQSQDAGGFTVAVS